MATASLCSTVVPPRLASSRRSPCLSRQNSPVPQFGLSHGCPGVFRSKYRMVSAFCEKAEALESLRSSSAGLGKHLDGVSDKAEPAKQRKKNAGFSATASQDLEDIEEINHANYYDKIENAGTPVVLIDFYTTWCGPCKLIYPTLLEMKDELAGQATFYKFNCNKANKEIGKDLEIKVAPTFLIYKGGKEVNRLTGAKIPPLQAALDEAIA